MTDDVVYVETSVIVGILLSEPDSVTHATRIKAANTRITGINNALEAAISIGRRIGDFQVARQSVEDFLEAFEIELLPAPIEILKPAVSAYENFGKGRRHPAQLNFGDCFSLAMADHHNARLIYKGSDFASAGW